MNARWSTLLVAAGLTAAALSACDAQPASVGDHPREVTVVGSGEVQGVPDTLTADVGVEFIASDVTTAMNRTDERQQAVIDALLDAGVERKDISTTGVSLQPQYGGTDGGGPAPVVGYRAGNTIRVKMAQDSASRAMAVIVTAGGDAARINSVTYSIDDESQLVRDARERAFNDAKARAEQYAGLSGLHLGRVISISEATGGGAPAPPPAPRSAMASPATLEPGQQTISFSVTVVWELN